MFNVEAAKTLVNIEKDTAAQLLQVGLAWNGSGWNTGTASKKLWEMCKIPLVQGDFKEYKDTWLFALAMALQVEVPKVDLSDRAADALFGLMEAILRVSSIVKTQQKDVENANKDVENLAWEKFMAEMSPDSVYYGEKSPRARGLSSPIS